MENNEEVENKVVLIGETSVGKTCIITQLIKGKYKEYIESSFTAQYCQKNFEFPGDKNITLDIWDTAGQERFRSLNRIFYSNAKAAILVYDITDQKSFDEIKNYWYGQIKKNCSEDIIIAIAANKSDLYEDWEVSNEKGEEFAVSINAIFSPTSAKNNNGIKYLFETIAKKMLNNNFNLKVSNTFIIKNKKKKNRKCCWILYSRVNIISLFILYFAIVI